MKHKIKKFSSFHAGCNRPGCTASIEGNIEDWNQKRLNDFFDGDCPYVSGKMSHTESVSYLLDYAKKQIKDWEKLVSYWEKK